jgi:effector-binding domain-containing protein
MDYKFEVSEPTAQPALAIRTRTPVAKLPEEMGKAFGAVYQYMLEIGEQPVGAAYAAYYNNDMNDMDVEIGFLVAKPLPGRENIKATAIPAGKQVSCKYKGSYSQMEPVYQAMTEWMMNNTYVPTGIAYELYYNDPSQVPETELLTRIVFPVKDSLGQ